MHVLQRGIRADSPFRLITHQRHANELLAPAGHARPIHSREIPHLPRYQARQLPDWCSRLQDSQPHTHYR